MGQLKAIRATPGVEVAAPVAMVGFVEWPSAYEQMLRSPGSEPSVYRVTASVVGDAGLSTYPIERRYVVISKRGDLDFSSLGGTLHLPGERTIDCAYPVNCFAGRVCGFGNGCQAGAYPSTRQARYYLPLLQPIVIAGIDPAAEAKVTALNHCVTSGRYLSQADQPIPSGNDEDPPFERIPVLVSTHAFVDQTLTVRVERASRPRELEQERRRRPCVRGPRYGPVRAAWPACTSAIFPRSTITSIPGRSGRRAT
jgi:putative ABC transport system permease protein